MTSNAASAVVIRRLQAIPEFDACVALQREVWGFSDADLVPRRMFVVANAIGGLVLGAFAGGAGREMLVAYALGVPGIREHSPYIHSHMLAVAPAYRNAGLGRQLKLRQRDWCLERGIELMEWTFDPLEIKNAWFNMSRLGAIARRYLPNHYGMSTSRLQAGLQTDRLVAEWWLRSARVETLLGGRPLPLPSIEARVEVPAAVQVWRHNGDARAVEVQTRNREALQGAFARGLAVVGYERGPAAESGDADGIYLLGRWRREEKAARRESEDDAD